MKKVISFQNNFIDKNLKDSISKFNKIKKKRPLNFRESL